MLMPTKSRVRGFSPRLRMASRAGMTTPAAMMGSTMETGAKDRATMYRAKPETFATWAMSHGRLVMKALIRSQESLALTSGRSRTAFFCR